MNVILSRVDGEGSQDAIQLRVLRSFPFAPLRVRMTVLACLLIAPIAAADDMAARVRSEFLFSWQAYEKYAWGHDELRPVSRTVRDWYGESLLMTPVDSLDTLILMGFKDEADKAHNLIVEKLSFDKDISVQNFEVTIRLLGGLLSAYEMTGDDRLLKLADDLGTRLLPVFNSPTGMPYRFVNLKTGKTSGAKSNPAEIGTLILEFGTLWCRSTNGARRSALSARRSMSKADSGPIRPAMSAERSIPITNTC